MADVLALIPARTGSKGIAHKNFRPLAGVSPLARAIAVANACGVIPFVSTDGDPLCAFGDISYTYLPRPAALARDDTPMLAVVQHALAAIPGPDDQIVLLLQPTQPLREPKHLTAAIELLASSGADSVVSVVELPGTHHPYAVCEIEGGRLEPFLVEWISVPAYRQGLTPVYMRDGTVYAFRRSTVAQYGHIYGQDVRPLIIPAEETCPLDTPEDWANADRRLRDRAIVPLVEASRSIWHA